ncbi:hypothetical protein LTS18_001291, partial [Coniosporium uncinatum]
MNVWGYRPPRNNSESSSGSVSRKSSPLSHSPVLDWSNLRKLQAVLVDRLSWVNQTLADDVRVEEKGEEGYYDWESDIRQLGAGSFGTVELYTRKDSNGNPVDRMARKYQRVEAQEWTHTTNWKDLNPLYPNEVALHGRLQSKQCPYTIGIRSYCVEEDLPIDERNIRTYIEYASYGTLKNVIQRYYQR